MNEERRPNPDALLADLQKQEQSASRGRLKIFLGMCPGVGKTCAMLKAAKLRQAEKVDVVAGVVETHGRSETTALLEGLPAIPRMPVAYRGTTLHEMDVDAILQRKPGLVLVDELAHSNAPGSRHPKRYQDVLELLDTGISVYSTLNVQHIESRVDVVRQITGVTIQETVPDSILDRADEVELIDLTPEQLRKRLDEGKVYLGGMAQAAAANFFREGNLKALREMSLRCAAEKADRDLRDFMRSKSIHGPWKSGERLLVAIGPSPYSESLIRWTRRVAGSMDSSWIAVYVDPGLPLDDHEKDRITRNLSLARHLGAEVVTTSGENIAQALLRVAGEHNVSQIVVGKPQGLRWWNRIAGVSLVDRLIQQSGDIDIYVVRPEKSPSPASSSNTLRLPSGYPQEWGWGLGLVALVTLVGCLLQSYTGYRAIALIYLMAVVGSALFLSRWPVLMVATLSALAWDFLFIPPRFTFYISEVHDVMMFFMLFATALAMGHLTSRLRLREIFERQREKRTATLFEFTQSAALSPDLEAGLRAALRKMDDLFQGTTVLLLRQDDHSSPKKPHPASSFFPSEKEISVASWAYSKRRPAGRFTDTLPESEAIYLPLSTRTSNMGVLGLLLEKNRSLDLHERELLEAFVLQTALIIEKDHWVQAASRAEIIEQSDRLKKTLLDSVSHELKTPIAAIQASLDAMEHGTGADSPFVAEIRSASQRLQQVVNSLLHMTRIDSGIIQPQLEWCDPSELLESAVEASLPWLRHHSVQIHASAGLPMVRLDPSLIEQSLVNLLSNAATYSPPGSIIQLSANLDDARLVLGVRDHGEGLPTPRPERVFEKFFRGPTARPGGTGLGLSIARGFVQAHHGTISASNPPDGGALFTISLPVEILPSQAVATTP